MRSYLKTLGTVLAELRRECGLSQEEVAARARRHPTYISQLERGLKAPTVRTLVLLSDVFGTQASDILKRTEEAMGQNRPPR